MGALYCGIKSLPVVLVVTICLSAPAQIRNIKVAEQAAGIERPVNPTIAINRKRPDNLVVGMTSNRAFYSLDTGKTWMESKLGSAGSPFEDPVLVSDGKGNFSLFRAMGQGGMANSAVGLSVIVHQVSLDGGKTWDAPVKMNPLSDKDEWMPRPAVHYLKSSLYVTWTQADHRRSADTSCQSNLWFRSSSNDEKRWSDPIKINVSPGDCVDEDDVPLGTPVMSTEGRLFVAWSNHGSVFFDRSYDGGKTWLPRDLAIASQPGGSAFSIPGIRRCQSPPVLLVDNSTSYFRSSLYVVWADQGSGENDTDIKFMRSTNRGDLWSTPTQVNQDGKGKHQFFPSATVDEATGIIYLLYYDRRAYDDLQTDVYLAYSVDGGLKFKEVKISESSFTPSAGKAFSNCTGISAVSGVIAAVWTRQDDQGNSVVTAVLKQSDIIKKEEAPKLQQIKRRTYAH